MSVRAKRWKLNAKRAVLARSDGKCVACGCFLTLESMTLDHIRPVARGGDSRQENLQAMCAPCNQRKGDKLFTIEERGFKFCRACEEFGLLP